MDRISNLPDEIVNHILSFLPIKEAALTSVLSKRWRNLFAFSPDLYLLFIDLDFWDRERNRSFTDFVDRVLAVSGNSNMRKFTLKLRQNVESAPIIRWLINVLRRGVLDLGLEMHTNNMITLPLEVFTCKTIVNLKLAMRTDVLMVPENASLPALKTLFLFCIRFSGCGFEALLSACPVLEELTVHSNPWVSEHSKQCRTVACPTLRRLTLYCKDNRTFSRGITFDTPSLAYLDYSDVVSGEYPCVNLNSLVEAKLSLKLNGKGDPRNLIKGLRNVEILDLFLVETSEILYSFAEEIPLFNNLSRLSIATGLGSCWRFVPFLLKTCPHLETLVIKGPLHFYDDVSGSLCECLSGYSFLLSCPVKVLEITKFRGTKGDLEHMKHFLGKLPCLELVNVRACPRSKLPLTRDLLMLPRASKIRVKFLP